MTWWTATSVSVNNGQTIVNVNTGDDVQIAQEAGGLVIGNQPPVEIKRTFLDGSNNKKIELRLPWPYSNQTNQPAVAFPTDADLAEATRILREVASDFDMQPTASSVAVRTSDGRLKATNATENNDVVTRGQFDSLIPRTTSATDTTANRLLKVGDFGIGATRTNLATLPNNDANVQGLPTGIYSTPATWVGSPYTGTASANQGVLIHSVGSVAPGHYAAQIWMRMQGANYFMRHCDNGVWSLWREVWHSGNLEKTTSATDNTLGRMLKVGDFGVGAQTRPVTELIELRPTLHLGASSTASNGPSYSSNILNQQWGPDTRWNTQLAVGVNTPKMSFRSVQFSTSATGTTTTTTVNPWYEVWHSGNLIITTSSTDTNAGRILKVGDFGVGSSSLTTVTSWPTVVGNYLVTNISTLPSCPVGATGSCIIIVERNNNYTLIENTTQTNRKIYQGTFPTAAGPDNVNGWVQIFHQGTILGTVSQSGGVPTGAIIQRGSNANGEFVRFADGTLICTGTTAATTTISTAFEGGFRSGGLTQAFPSPFLNQDYRLSPTPSARANTPPFSIGHQLSASATSFGFQLHAVTSQTSKTYQFDWIAIGRWF